MKKVDYMMEKVLVAYMMKNFDYMMKKVDYMMKKVDYMMKEVDYTKKKVTLGLDSSSIINLVEVVTL